MQERTHGAISDAKEENSEEKAGELGQHLPMGAVVLDGVSTNKIDINTNSKH